MSNGRYTLTKEFIKSKGIEKLFVIAISERGGNLFSVFQEESTSYYVDENDRDKRKGFYEEFVDTTGHHECNLYEISVDDLNEEIYYQFILKDNSLSGSDFVKEYNKDFKYFFVNRFIEK